MNAALYALQPDHISSYLQLNGWKLVNTNERCYVFEGYEDIDSNPFEVVLPINFSAPDYPIYVEHTVRILSALTDKSPKSIADEMLLFDYDVFFFVVDAYTEVESISVDLAATQVPRIKTLVGHSANSERNARPYFSRLSSYAKKMVEHFEFGCKQNGSFSYMIKSPVGELRDFQYTRHRQLDLPMALPPIVPLQRRVMERIARGLITTEKAAEMGGPEPIIKGYADGFNANMCDAVLKISKEQAEPIQYRVSWSKKITASEGIRRVRNFKIHRRHHDYLRAASDTLKELQPTFQKITGLVIALSSLGDPQSDKVDERSIIVLWEQRTGRTRKLRINLGKTDYLKAHKAHMDWKTISVDGIVVKRRSQWQLSDPHEFKIL